MDIWGPCVVNSMNGDKYFLTIVDDHSKFTWLYLMKSKAETHIHLINFVSMIKTQFQKTIKIIRTDNGLEFNMTDIFKTEAIIHQTSCIETPEQNGLVERKHQHIMNVTRALLFQSNLSQNFWNFVVLYVVNLINCLPTPFLKDSTPFEILYGNAFDMRQLHVFGCLCYVSTISANRTKLDPRALIGIFLGFKPNVKGYVVYDLKSHSIHVSRNVIFYENKFPFKIISHEDYVDKIATPILDYDFDLIIPNCLSDKGVSENNELQEENTSDSTRLNNEPDIDSRLEQNHLRKSTRHKTAPAYLQDFQTSFATKIGMKSRYPIEAQISLARLSPSFKEVICSIDSHAEPESYKDTSYYEHWQKAMKEELLALE